MSFWGKCWMVFWWGVVPCVALIGLGVYWNPERLPCLETRTERRMVCVDRGGRYCNEYAERDVKFCVRRATP